MLRPTILQKSFIPPVPRDTLSSKMLAEISKCRFTAMLKDVFFNEVIPLEHPYLLLLLKGKLYKNSEKNVLDVSACCPYLRAIELPNLSLMEENWS